MKATPMQKYAMRLLMAAEKIQPPSPAIWNDLQRESADLCLAPFGGTHKAITELKIKETPQRLAAARGPAADTLVVRRTKSQEKDTLHDL